jgi:transposase
MPPGGRRQYSDEAKRRIVEESCQPDVSVSAVARRYGVTSSLLFRWRRMFGVEPLPEKTAFAPVALLDDGSVPAPRDPTLQPDPTDAVPAAPAIIVERPAPGIEIALTDGRRIRFDREVDPDIIRRVIATLEEVAPLCSSRPA